MSGQSQFGMSCLEFEALLADDLDQVLSGEAKQRFDLHRRECASCRALYDEARAGIDWLHSLREVEPPAGLVHNIMMATAGALPAQAAPLARPSQGWRDRLRQWIPLPATPALQPRFVMAFGMAFFSLSVLLNVAGFKLRDLRYVDLRPSAIVRGYYETTGRLTRYYENIRVVYEIESRVQQLKRMTAPEQTTPPSTDKDKNPSDKSGVPDPKFQNYTREEGQPVVAAAPAGRYPSASTVRRPL